MNYKIIDTNLLDLHLDKLKILVRYSDGIGQKFLSEELARTIEGISELIFEEV